MTSLATVLIPYSPAHAPLVKRAIESVKTQTVACQWVAGESPRTPATLRNHALEVDTPFVVFLDADDWLEPDFIAECLKVYQEGKYVYTGWYMGYKVVTPDASAPFNDGHHLVTTLYPTEAFKYLGGFNTELPGGEDLEFYLASAFNGICGVLCDKPLLHYTGNGERSLAYENSPLYFDTQDAIWQRYGGKQVAMACCGNPNTPAPPNPGEKQDGDVWAEALWAGIRKEIGHATQRVYRSGNRNRLWVSPKDIERMPSLFRAVPDVKKMTPNRAAVLREAGLLGDDTE